MLMLMMMIAKLNVLHEQIENEMNERIWFVLATEARLSFPHRTVRRRQAHGPQYTGYLHIHFHYHLGWTLFK